MKADGFTTSLAAEISAALYPGVSPAAMARGCDEPAGLVSCFDVTGLAVASISAATAQ
ncbi:hypothetical protein [Congregibacter sp.]|uniref:hypothetical protein n=1 Tax=Congregibacter sp. TaxID=2744308 RepID=UPI003F6AF549